MARRTIPAGRLGELSGGRLHLDVPVLLNQAVVEHYAAANLDYLDPDSIDLARLR